MLPTLRRARPDEAPLLTALAHRSKRHWGYDDAFMEAARDEMEISPALVARAVTVLAELGGTLAGFYVLAVEEEGPTLRDLWVEPGTIDTGLGAHLWPHMIGEARAAGFRAVRLVSDPNAAGFYARMGARRAGEIESAVVKGRRLPAFEVAIPDCVPARHRGR